MSEIEQNLCNVIFVVAKKGISSQKNVLELFELIKSAFAFSSTSFQENIIRRK